MTSKGHSIWLNGEEGYILQKGSAIQEQMHKCFQQLVKQLLHRWGGSLELTKERGIYNVYVKVPKPSTQESVPLCPNEMEVETEEARHP
eukprot:875015-Amphidinium_carterae.1